MKQHVIDVQLPQIPPLTYSPFLQNIGSELVPDLVMWTCFIGLSVSSLPT